MIMENEMISFAFNLENNAVGGVTGIDRNIENEAFMFVLKQQSLRQNKSYINLEIFVLFLSICLLRRVNYVYLEGCRSENNE